MLSGNLIGRGKISLHVPLSAAESCVQSASSASSLVGFGDLVGERVKFFFFPWDPREQGQAWSIPALALEPPKRSFGCFQDLKKRILG